MRKKQLLFILDWYPTATNNGCVFAKHLICAIADQGYDCRVIAPRIVSRQILEKKNKVPVYRKEMTDAGNKIRIYMPYYLYLSSRKQTIRLSMNNHYNAVMKTIRKYGLKPDLVYGHFLYQCGLTAARVGEAFHIPSWYACGENSLRLQKNSKSYSIGLKHADWRSYTQKLSGVISVSSYNKKLLLKNKIVPSDTKVGVFPNGIDSRRFYKKDRLECRKKLGFPEDIFIVAFTGAFTSNKGADRLNQALKQCDNIYSIFLGQGPVTPDCDNILYSGRVANDQVCDYLNAADIFVLPTRGEGCSNAIVEALACGLPVISSGLSFNDDILDTDNSIRIDVESVEDIKNAILKLRDNTELRKQLSINAEVTGKQLDIQKRARRILEFMEM